MTTSIWLAPTPDAQSTLRRANDHMKAALGGPTVVPHVTLLGGIELEDDEALSRFKETANALTQMDVNLVKFGFGTIWSQAAYMLAEPEPLRSARQIAVSVFNMQAEPFMAHASLLYGTFPLESRRDAVSQLSLPLPLTLTLNRLELWDTTNTDERDVDNWHCLAGADLRRAGD